MQEIQVTANAPRTIQPLTFPKVMIHKTNGATVYFSSPSNGIVLNNNGITGMPVVQSTTSNFEDFDGEVVINQSPDYA